MRLAGWGNFPTIVSKAVDFYDLDSVLSYFSNEVKYNTIVRGLGRSYGDSSLAESTLSLLRMHHLISFDAGLGVLSCYAGATIDEILTVFVPKGWFMPVTPGTKLITIGGAVASDVHGKNHHFEGSFCDHVLSLKIVVPYVGLVECSSTLNAELFKATCGGMGLTGVIVEVKFKLKAINSAYIDQVTIKAKNLTSSLELFDEYSDYPYSVAWIDCLANGEKFGRSLLMLGEHSDYGELIAHGNRVINVPFDFPDFLMNKKIINVFNSLYYNSKYKTVSKSVVHYNDFFYPLDSIGNWNKMYGKNGFIQYQFVVPKEVGIKGVSDILERITASQRGSFLAVLKCFGKGNNNFLSFPVEGYTLALDFKITKGLFGFLEELDEIVLDYGGRLYLAKDSRMSKRVFEKGYSDLDKFVDIREKYEFYKVFNSLQSLRLGV